MNHKIMMMHVPIWLVMVMVLFSISAPPALGVPVTLTDVPAYKWYHGCGPTAAASVLGYWDLHGYSNMFDANGPTDIFMTANVQDQISSPEHNARYDPKPDDLTQPQSWNSIADWFHTSEGSLNFGWSYLHYADDAFIGYANYRGFTFDAWNASFGANFFWDNFVAEIDAGRPMMFLVDSSGDGITDHFVPTLGYDDRGTDGLWYGLYDTWGEDETIRWEQFRGMSNSYQWGVGYATFVSPVSASVPVPSTMLLLGSGLFGLGTFRKKFKI